MPQVFFLRHLFWHPVFRRRVLGKHVSGHHEFNHLCSGHHVRGHSALLKHSAGFAEYFAATPTTPDITKEPVIANAMIVFFIISASFCYIYYIQLK